jgi:hypothetical protein
MRRYEIAPWSSKRTNVLCVSLTFLGLHRCGGSPSSGRQRARQARRQLGKPRSGSSSRSCQSPNQPGESHPRPNLWATSGISKWIGAVYRSGTRQFGGRPRQRGTRADLQQRLLWFLPLTACNRRNVPERESLSFCWEHSRPKSAVHGWTKKWWHEHYPVLR